VGNGWATRWATRWATSRATSRATGWTTKPGTSVLRREVRG